MTTRLEAIEARNQRVGQTQSKVRWPRPDIEVLTRDDVPLLLSVAWAATEEHAAMDAYLAAHSNSILTDADADAFGEAAERLEVARHKLQTAIASLLEEVRE